MRTFKTLQSGCLLILAILISGCSGKQNVWVYVDNGLDTAMNVEVDGVEMAEVPPKAFQKIVVPVGQRSIKVTSAGETIYEGSKKVAGSREAFVTQRYLFNPDENNLYWSYNTKHGKDGMLSKAIQNASAGDEMKAEFRKLRKEFDVMPSENWFAIPKGAYVLEDVPSRVATQGTAITSKVVSRVQKDHYKFLKSIKTMRQPTTCDLMDLEYVYSSSTAN